MIYTIGHSTHEVDYFIELLDKHEINMVLDVRSIPYSRYTPQFNREILLKRLFLAGIDYGWCGDVLGGKDVKVEDYDAHRKTKLFKGGIEEVADFPFSVRTAIMCSEHDHNKCHRNLMVAKSLEELGVEVSHILRDGSIE